ncbi:PRD domain-containing protein [Corynebacterium mastitidis]|uniref:PRD domain-containing protein n=1 Tax=Corynebacterium mastitidis TaxID=161890 RepID=UPI0030EADB89
MDRQGLAAARFITHMRYFFARVAQEGQWHDGGSALAQTLEQSYPEAVACAGKLAAVLELRLGVELSSDERAYLALHVARL